MMFKAMSSQDIGCGLLIWNNALGLWCNQSCCASCAPLSQASSSRMSYHDGDAWSHFEGEKIHDSLSSGSVLVGNSLTTVTWPWQKVMDLDEAQATEQRFACEGVPGLWSTCTSRRSQMNVMLRSLGCRCSFPWLAVIQYWCESVVACLIAFSLSRCAVSMNPDVDLPCCECFADEALGWSSRIILRWSQRYCCLSPAWIDVPRNWIQPILGWMGTCPVEVNKDADV